MTAKPPSEWRGQTISIAAMRSLITSGVGFIGCHLAEELLRERRRFT
jgi:hypothetical protein